MAKTIAQWSENSKYITVSPRLFPEYKLTVLISGQEQALWRYTLQGNANIKVGVNKREPSGTNTYKNLWYIRSRSSSGKTGYWLVNYRFFTSNLIVGAEDNSSIGMAGCNPNGVGMDVSKAPTFIQSGPDDKYFKIKSHGGLYMSINRESLKVELTAESTLVSSEWLFTEVSAPTTFYRWIQPWIYIPDPFDHNSFLTGSLKVFLYAPGSTRVVQKYVGLTSSPTNLRLRDNTTDADTRGFMFGGLGNMRSPGFVDETINGQYGEQTVGVINNAFWKKYSSQTARYIKITGNSFVAGSEVEGEHDSSNEWNDLIGKTVDRIVPISNSKDTRVGFYAYAESNGVRLTMTWEGGDANYLTWAPLPVSGTEPWPDPVTSKIVVFKFEPENL